MKIITLILKKHVLLFAIALPIIHPINALGVQVTWNLDDIVFDDGGRASGYFIFDTEYPIGSELAITDWEITVSGGDETLFPEFTYDPSNSVSGYGQWGSDDVVYYMLQFAKTDDPSIYNDRLLSLRPSEVLISTNGTIPLNLDDGYIWNYECYNCNPYRLITSGSIVAQTPEVSLEISGPDKTWVHAKEQNNPNLYLHASGVPEGGIYNWEVTQGDNKLKIVEEDENSVTLTPLLPSESPQDVEVTVTYTVNSISATATKSITIVKPSCLCECQVDGQPEGQNTICSCQESGGITMTKTEDPTLAFRFQTLYYYAVVDQFQDLLAPTSFSAPMQPFSETVKQFKSNYNASDGCPIMPRVIREADVHEYGILKDSFIRDCVFLSENPTDIVTTAKQTIEVAGWELSTRDITYFSDYALSQETNPDNICPYPTQIELPFHIVPSFDTE